MRRLALLFVGGAVWLILAALPAAADGGPHVMKFNNGSTGGITADGCAACHRIHTSKSPTGYLLVSSEATVTEYCRSCHGASGTGAATDVDSGVQYNLSGVARDTSTTVGALRGGGFITAYIGSGAAYRLVSNTGSVSNSKVPVANISAAGAKVTSAHIAIAGTGGNGLTPKNIVWGSGALGNGDGSTGAGGDLASRWNARPAITRTGTATTGSCRGSQTPAGMPPRGRPWRRPPSTSRTRHSIRPGRATTP